MSERSIDSDSVSSQSSDDSAAGDDRSDRQQEPFSSIDSPWSDENKLFALIDSASNDIPQAVKALEKLVAENPNLLDTCRNDHDELMPLHYAVKNDAPLDIIKVLAKAKPEVILMDYYLPTNQGGSWRSRYSFLDESKSSATRAYLVDEALRHLHSTFSNHKGKEWHLVHDFFLNHALTDVSLIDRMLEEFPDLNKHFNVMNEAVADGCSNEILQRLKDIWYPRAFAERTDGENETPLHAACSSRPRDLTNIKLLMSPEALRAHDDDGRLPLHWCCRREDEDEDHEPQVKLDCIRVLVEAYPESVKEKDAMGNTPLHEACSNNDSDVLHFLLEAYPESAHQRNNKGKTPLHLLCQSLSEATPTPASIRIFVEHSPEAITKKDSEGSMPLHLLCTNRLQTDDDLSCVQLLIDSHPESGMVVNDKGCTPLHVICNGGNDSELPVVRFLAERYPQSLGVADQNGYMPLHFACNSTYGKNVKVVEFLTERYSDALRIRSNYCDDENRLSHATPLDLAARFCGADSCDTLRFLAQACPEVLEPSRDSRGNTPLHILCGKHHESPALGESPVPSECVRALAISEKAVKAKDDLGQTALHLLCERGASLELAAVQVLLDKCPGVTGICDDQGQTPLHKLVEGYDSSYTWRLKANYEVGLKWLLNVNPVVAFAEDLNGKTPLSLACEGNASLNVIYQLVRVNPLRALGLEQGPAPVMIRKRKRES